MSDRPADIGRFGDRSIAPGERADLHLHLGSGYVGADVRVPMHVWRGAEPGPTVFITGAVHGDEINGTGVIRRLLRAEPFVLKRGALLLVPVVNIFGFERHSRYLPDRRDLNRHFPGNARGSSASRVARAFFDEVVCRSNYGIDLHTAAVRRTNYPNVRADMSDSAVHEFARSFGAELILDSPGPDGSLRRAASRDGCPTFILEAGEVWKVEPTICDYAMRGIRNCLAGLGMIDEPAITPSFQVVADATAWVRADMGGFLEFHVVPGSIVEADEAIATNTNLTGETQNVIRAPRSGIVVGMTTLPAVSPGDAVCHLAYLRKGSLRRAELAISRLSEKSLLGRLRGDLASSIQLTPDAAPDDAQDQ